MPRRTCLLLLAVLGVGSSCRDGRSPVEPTAPTTGSFELVLPDLVKEGEPFTLTVTAVAMDGTRPDRAFTGEVTLTTSSGSVSPASLQLTAGVGSGDVALNGDAGTLTLTARAGGATGSASLTVLGSAPPVRMEISPATLLLPGAGASQALTVHAYDAQGRPTAVAVTWRSSSPAVIVAADGTATAAQPLGSALITAEAAGITSAPAVALVARPTAGTVLVSDAQVVGDPVQVDPADAFGPGWRYRVMLRDIAVPAPGTRLLASGDAVVAGRVVDAAPAGTAVAVTLELVPLKELFDELEIRLTLPLEMDNAVAAPQSASGPGHTQATMVGAATETEIEFALGAFKCKVAHDRTLPSLALHNVSTSVTGGLTGTLDFSLTAGIETLAVRGSIGGQLTARPVLDLAWDGRVKCERDIIAPTLPLGAWLALFFGFNVPIGVGVSLDAGLELGQVGFDIAAQATAEVEMEYSCPLGGGCSWSSAVNSDADGTLRPVLPSFEDAHLTLDGRGYLYAKLNLGPTRKLLDRMPFLEGLKFKLLEASAGIEQSVDLAGQQRQAADPAYASSFMLRFNAEVKADLEMKTGFEWLERQLGLVVQFVEHPLFLYEDTLARSPTGSLAIQPETVAAGDTTQLGEKATFTVTLDPVTYVGLYAVEGVDIRWRKDDGNGGFTLALGRPGCTSIAAAPGQTTFSCQADFLPEHVGEQSFHAFVRAKLFGLTVPVPLEIAKDARASVTVRERGRLTAHILFPDSVEGGTPTPVRVRVGRLLDDGGVEYGSGYQVALEVDRGTVAPATGITDAAGFAEAIVTAQPDESYIIITAHATSSLGDSVSVLRGAVVMRPPGTLIMNPIIGWLCNQRLGLFEEDLPFSGSVNLADDPDFNCAGTLNITLTREADGVVIFEATAHTTHSSFSWPGTVWEVILTHEAQFFHYTVDVEVEGRRGAALFWGPDGPIACATIDLTYPRFSGFPCSTAQTVTGIGRAGSYNVSVAAGAPAGNPTTTKIKLTLTPVQ